MKVLNHSARGVRLALLFLMIYATAGHTHFVAQTKVEITSSSNFMPSQLRQILSNNEAVILNSGSIVRRYKSVNNSVRSLGLIPAQPSLPSSVSKKHRELSRKLLGRTILPVAHDNSQCLPPVGDQGEQGSCASWAVGYYVKSYHEAKERGWTLADPANQFSPAFLYNQLQYFDEGSTLEQNLNVLIEQGCAAMLMMPYDEADHQEWPSPEAYYEALPYRELSYNYLGHGETIDIFPEIKEILVDGDLIVAGIPVFRPDPNTEGRFGLLTANDSDYDMPASTERFLAGYHAVTIVGYDESRFDGKGGYKVVNS